MKNYKKEGIDWIDVGRLFKVPQTDGTEKWQFNYLGRKEKSGLKVLVRNAMFESNISQVNPQLIDVCMILSKLLS